MDLFLWFSVGEDFKVVWKELLIHQVFGVSQQLRPLEWKWESKTKTGY